MANRKPTKAAIAKVIKEHGQEAYDDAWALYPNEAESHKVVGGIFKHARQSGRAIIQLDIEATVVQKNSLTGEVEEGAITFKANLQNANEGFAEKLSDVGVRGILGKILADKEICGKTYSFARAIRDKNDGSFIRDVRWGEQVFPIVSWWLYPPAHGIPLNPAIQRQNAIPQRKWGGVEVEPLPDGDVADWSADVLY